MPRKKLSVKLYLNKNVKPVTVSVSSGEHYPVYARVTYDGKSTMFRVTDKHGGGVLFSENLKDLESRLSPDNFFVNHKSYPNIQTFLEYELEVVGEDNYQVKGLGNRLESIYMRPLYEALRLNDTFLDIVGDKLNEEKELRAIWNATYSLYNPFRLYHLAKFDKPDLPQGMSNQQLLTLHTAVLLWLFCDQSATAVEALTSEVWITGKAREEFVDFIAKLDSRSEIASSKAAYANFFSDFELNISNPSIYLNFIDLAIKNNILETYR